MPEFGGHDVTLGLDDVGGLVPTRTALSSGGCLVPLLQARKYVTQAFDDEGGHACSLGGFDRIEAQCWIFC